MASKPKEHPLVLVEWIDSCGLARKWHDPSIIEEYAPLKCKSVGWLGRKDTDYLVMYSSWQPDEVGDVFAIPASCVTKITKLKVKG